MRGLRRELSWRAVILGVLAGVVVMGGLWLGARALVWRESEEQVEEAVVFKISTLARSSSLTAMEMEWLETTAGWNAWDISFYDRYYASPGVDGVSTWLSSRPASWSEHIAWMEREVLTGRTYVSSATGKSGEVTYGDVTKDDERGSKESGVWLASEIKRSLAGRIAPCVWHLRAHKYAEARRALRECGVMVDSEGRRYHLGPRGKVLEDTK